MTTSNVVMRHYGVKGMHWGVRQEERKQRTQRVAQGEGTAGEKFGVLMNTSVLDLARNKGSLKKVAAGKTHAMEMKKRRVETKTLTKRDKLQDLVNFNATDVAINTKNRYKYIAPAYHDDPKKRAEIKKADGLGSGNPLNKVAKPGSRQFKKELKIADNPTTYEEKANRANELKLKKAQAKR